MTKDLEETLAELGPEYREVVNRLRAAYCAPKPFVQPKASETLPHSGRVTGWSVGYLIAATFLIFLGIGIAFRPSHGRGGWVAAPQVVYTVAYAPDETALAAIVGSQRADGSWANDFLTQQNAAALRGVDGSAERIAYKKAVRYLRSKGLRPLTDEELKMRGDAAARMLVRG